MGKRKSSKEDDLNQAEPVTPVAGDEEDPDSDGDEYAAGVVSMENTLKPGDYEVEDLEANITIVRGGQKMTQEEIKSEDEHVIAAAAADERFQMHTANRRLRFNSILERGKAASELQHQNVLEATDDWKGMKKVGKKFSEMIECKFGNYVETSRGHTGLPRVRQMTDKEMQEMTAIDATDSEPCECKICKERRENAVTVAPAPGLRSGKKLGWDKYGPGRTL